MNLELMPTVSLLILRLKRHLKLPALPPPLLSSAVKQLIVKGALSLTPTLNLPSLTFIHQKQVLDNAVCAPSAVTQLLQYIQWSVSGTH